MVDPRRNQYAVISAAENKIRILKSKFPENYSEQPEYIRAKNEIRLAQDKIKGLNRMIQRGVRF